MWIGGPTEGERHAEGDRRAARQDLSVSALLFKAEKSRFDYMTTKDPTTESGDFVKIL